MRKRESQNDKSNLFIQDKAGSIAPYLSSGLSILRILHVSQKTVMNQIRFKASESLISVDIH